MNGRRALATLAVVLLATATLLARDIRITPIPTEGRVLVSFVARDAWTLGIRDALKAGLSVRYDYTVELRRPGLLWFDPLMARASITAMARFNTLTGEHQAHRMRGGSIFDSKRFKGEAEVRDWLTSIEQIVLDPVTPLEPNAEYYVQVDLSVTPRLEFSIWSLWPFSKSPNTGRAYFPYVR
jgi:hypothetical protein